MNYTQIPNTITKFIEQTDSKEKLNDWYNLIINYDWKKTLQEIKINNHSKINPNFDYVVDHFNPIKIAVIMTLLRNNKLSINTCYIYDTVSYSIYSRHMWSDSFSSIVYNELIDWIED